MAICLRPRPVLAAEVGRGLAAPGTGTAAGADDKTADDGTAAAPGPGTAAAVDDKTAVDGTAVAPQALYLVIAAAVIVAGGFAGTVIHDHWARAVSFVPPQGIGIFALLYIIAQVIERVQ